MAASAPKIIIDPTRNTTYPVILSDALLGKTSKETFTGVRYNTRPTLSSDTGPTTARIKQSARDGTYNLGIDEKGERWQYQGQRTSGDDKYVLVFDPARKAFVLHRVDSMFHMNVTRTPSTSDVEKLRQEFPRLEVDKKHVVVESKKSQTQERAAEKTSGAAPVKRPVKDKAAGVFAKPTRKAPVTLDSAKAREAMPPPPPPNKKKEIQKKPESAGLSMPSVDCSTKSAKPPTPKKEEKKPKKRSAESEEEEEDDDDDLLQIEYPDGSAPQKPAFSPDFLPQGRMPIVRRFSEFVRDHQQEEDDVQDADAEFDAFNFEEAEEEENEDLEMEDVQPFKLPSPVNNGNPSQTEDATHGSVEDMDDLEAELARELDGLNGNDSDSSVSEED